MTGLKGRSLDGDDDMISELSSTTLGKSLFAPFANWPLVQIKLSIGFPAKLTPIGLWTLNLLLLKNV